MKKTVLKLFCLLALLGVPAAQAATTLYDIQFSHPAYSDTRQTGPAVIGTAGDYWNLMTNATGSASLLDSVGTANGVSLSWSADGIYQIYFPISFGGNAPLMSGYIYASSAHGVSFSGLPAGQPCTLYIYSQADGPGDRQLSVTVNGTTYTTTPSAFPTYFIAGQNYLAITGVTDGSGNLDLSYNVAAGEANLNGIQLIMDSPALSITTQPSSQVAAVGGAVNLSVTAAGAVPLSFQWFKNGGMVSGATNRLLSLASAAMTDSGVYYVAATNAEGLVISQPVTVAVGAPQLLTWGWNNYGQLGDGTKINRSNAVSVASHVVAVSAGSRHSLFVKDDGALWAMGLNDHGQLGDGTAINRRNAVSVASNVVATAGGDYYTLFVKGDGTLWGMGQNSYGELGDGTCTYSRSNAVSVASNVTALAAGAHHSLFLKGDGTLWAMGANSEGRLGDGTTSARSNAVSVASNVVALAAGELSFPVCEG